MAYFIIDWVDGAAHTQGVPDFAAPTPGSARWYWDGQLLAVARRPLDFFPLFLLRDGHRFGIATSLGELLPFLPAPRLDETAIAVFLRLGHYIGDDTPFTAIRAMPPVDGLRWTAGKEQPGAPFRQPGVIDWDRDRIKSHYRTLFSTAIARIRSDREFVLPLTGGRDSRHILLELIAQDRIPARVVTARTFPPNDDGDIRTAAALAARLHIDHEVRARPRNRFRTELRKNALIGYGSHEHGWSLPLACSLRDKALVDGMGGDVLSQSAFLDAERDALYRAGKLAPLARLLTEGSAGALGQILSAEASRRFSRTLAEERICQELKRYLGLHNPMTQFSLWNRTRRTIALNSFCLLGRHNQMFTPFLDADLATFLLSLPVRQTIGKTLHDEVIAESYPDFAAIPYAGKGAAVVDRAGTMAFMARMIAYARQPDRAALVHAAGLLRESARAVRRGHVSVDAARILNLLQLAPLAA